MITPGTDAMLGARAVPSGGEIGIGRAETHVANRDIFRSAALNAVAWSRDLNVG